MIKINLLPVRAEKKKESIRQQFIIAGMVLAATFVAIGFMHSGINSQIAAAKKKVEETKAKIEHLKSIIGEVDKFKQTKKDLEQKLEIIAALENNRLGPVMLLDEISKAIPERTWLTDMTQKGSTIAVKGLALDTNNVAAFMDNLEKSEMFSGVKLGQTSSVQEENYRLVQFDLTFSAAGLEIPTPQMPAGGEEKGKKKKGPEKRGKSEE